MKLNKKRVSNEQDVLGKQKTVSLSTLLKIGARKVSFCDLNAAVLEAYLLSQKKGSN